MSESLVHPLSETAQVGGDTGGAEGATLQRRVAPGLIVRRIEREVVGGEEVIVGHVEDAVVAVQIARHEKNLHRVAGQVAETELPNLTHDAVIVEIPKVVGDDGIGQRCLRFFFAT